MIYYRSINREKKILAFALFELSSNYQIEKTLQNFVKRGLILFYSIEINIVYPEKIVYLFCISDNNKSEIFKNFNLISYNLNQITPSINFFKNEKLEKEFLKILSLDKKKNSLINNATGSIRVKDDSKIKTLNFYIINYDKVGEADDIIYQFINYLRSLKRHGYLILNFQLINERISVEIYYIDYIDDLNHQVFDLVSVVNEFFNIELICQLNLEIKKLFLLLLRYRLTKNTNYFQDTSKIHNLEYYYNYKNLLDFTNEFNELLEANEIQFHQLNKNLYILEQSTLVIILVTVRFKFLLNILKKFRSKFNLLLIILNDKGYEDLLKIEKISTIPNLKILNYEEFCHFDLKSLKYLNN
ncbi:MAG: hypothetical protein EU531_10195 [Promethearchaeota archaeon]|nr:MAG: hypothetical protein EU531_10195 [Candidatus Lokiarchaeota archaeon]